MSSIEHGRSPERSERSGRSGQSSEVTRSDDQSRERAKEVTSKYEEFGSITEQVESNLGIYRGELEKTEGRQNSKWKAYQEQHELDCFDREKRENQLQLIAYSMDTQRRASDVVTQLEEKARSAHDDAILPWDASTGSRRDAGKNQLDILLRGTKALYQDLATFMQLLTTAPEYPLPDYPQEYTKPVETRFRSIVDRYYQLLSAAKAPDQTQLRDLDTIREKFQEAADQEKKVQDLETRFIAELYERLPDSEQSRQKWREAEARVLYFDCKTLRENAQKNPGILGEELLAVEYKRRGYMEELLKAGYSERTRKPPS
jgi:hypothetical protein